MIYARTFNEMPYITHTITNDQGKDMLVWFPNGWILRVTKCIHLLESRDQFVLVIHSKLEQ